jgi:hypothetical protein
MKNMIATLSFGVCLMISTMYQNAHAGYIDETPEISEWTTIKDVDWLRWDITSGLTIDEALEANLGWRMATKVELDKLFFEVFGDLNYSNDRVSVNYSPSRSETELVADFVSEFEKSGAASYGAYAMTPSGRYGASFGSPTTYPRLTYDAGCDVSSCGPLAPYSSIGYAMVRSTEVPEPSTLLIFALGIIGLASRKFKKQF